MFLHLSVSHSVHGGFVCLSACWDTTPLGRHPSPTGQTLPGQTPPGQTRTLGRHPRADSPWADTPPPHCSGRYVSYWNAFLLN